ncbi:MAG: hypothetical protein A2X81_08550 [Desulfobacterales bacterium GWB2_56_26]|nr:MAG: hypothetical protein A2X81_08550 [Desulfobacterales bacterium GWB2_56_26]
MKKKHLGICTGLTLIGMTGIAQAGLITIGTATYSGQDYNLIWDNDNNGKSVVWLDYSNTYGNRNWESQTSWAAGLDSNLTYNIAAQYSVSWDDNAWRLPSTADGPYVYGTNGNTTAGYNITSSEMGHLYYEENRGEFENLIKSSLVSWYWSGTEYTSNTDYAWSFNMYSGYQTIDRRDYGDGYGLAIRSGQVSTASPVPEPTTMLLFSVGLVGLAGLKRRKGKSV